MKRCSLHYRVPILGRPTFSSPVFLGDCIVGEAVNDILYCSEAMSAWPHAFYRVFQQGTGIISFKQVALCN